MANMAWRLTAFLTVMTLMIFSAFYFARPPIDGPALEIYLANTQEGRFFSDSLRRFSENDSSLIFDLQKIDDSGPEELNSKLRNAQTFAADKKLKFGRFDGFNRKEEGDKITSQIGAWFLSESQPNLFVNVIAKFAGTKANLKLHYIDFQIVNHELDLSYPPDLLSWNGFRGLSGPAISAIFLTLASLCLSSAAIVSCLFSLRKRASKLWLLPVMFGVIPVTVSLSTGELTYKFLEVGVPVGWFGNSFYSFGIDITRPGQIEHALSGQVITFSFPIAIIYFLRHKIAAARTGA